MKSAQPRVAALQKDFLLIIAPEDAEPRGVFTSRRGVWSGWSQAFSECRPFQRQFDIELEPDAQAPNASAGENAEGTISTSEEGIGVVR